MSREVLPQEVKPCPFCKSTDLRVEYGGEESHFIQPEDLFFHYWVECLVCDTQGPTALTPEKAAELWNIRPE
jgi:hypothetical protein